MDFNRENKCGVDSLPGICIWFLFQWTVDTIGNLFFNLLVGSYVRSMRWFFAYLFKFGDSVQLQKLERKYFWIMEQAWLSVKLLL